MIDPTILSTFGEALGPGYQTLFTEPPAAPITAGKSPRKPRKARAKKTKKSPKISGGKRPRRKSKSRKSKSYSKNWNR
jgi:hypothetical protein